MHGLLKHIANETVKKAKQRERETDVKRYGQIPSGCRRGGKLIWQPSTENRFSSAFLLQAHFSHFKTFIYYIYGTAPPPPSMNNTNAIDINLRKRERGKESVLALIVWLDAAKRYQWNFLASYANYTKNQ